MVFLRSFWKLSWFLSGEIIQREFQCPQNLFLTAFSAQRSPGWTLKFQEKKINKTSSLGLPWISSRGFRQLQAVEVNLLHSLQRHCFCSVTWKLSCQIGFSSLSYSVSVFFFNVFSRYTQIDSQSREAPPSSWEYLQCTEVFLLSW